MDFLRKSASDLTQWLEQQPEDASALVRQRLTQARAFPHQVLRGICSHERQSPVAMANSWTGSLL